jgi:hypothetical protein
MSRSAKFGALLSATALSYGVSVALAPLSLGERSASRLPAPAPSAVAARTVSLNESGRLHLTSKHGFTLNEQGAASGTIRGTIYAHLKLVSTSRVTAEVNIYLNGGSISGEGAAGYRRAGTTASFFGSMAITRGTGSYGRVRGSGLSFSGTIQESSNDAVTVRMSGRVSG